MDLAKSFGALNTPAEPKPDQAQPVTTKKPAAKAKPQAAAAPIEKAWTRGEGKSSNPDYGRLTVYVPKKLRVTAERKWQDRTGKDASDLIEHLLSEYVDT